MDQRKKISERDIRTKEREISEYLKVHCVPEDYAAVKLQQFVALQTRFECANTLEVMARMMYSGVISIVSRLARGFLLDRRPHHRTRSHRTR